jgi:GTP-binding protein EngB required for normal cell division
LLRGVDGRISGNITTMNSNHRADDPSTPGESSSRRDGDDSLIPGPSRPGYMTVGSGSTPEAAARLVSMLDDDSGYGASMIDGESFAPNWHSNMNEDGSSSTATAITPGATGEHERQRSHILQLRYNQNKNALGRAIHGTIDTLKSFQDMNMKWPAHYPAVQQQEPLQSQLRPESRPGLQHTQSAIGGNLEPIRSPERPRPPRRAGTSLGEEFSGEPSSSKTSPPKQEPRLMTPQLAQDFAVLKIDLRMGGRNQTDLVHSLEKGSIASLLDGQIQQSIRHLYSIKERIEDTSSKVLVTGDLNAGKSTFCNALLRRKVLPEDQQPCTSIFCEVLDSRENGGVEEVHAVPTGSRYNRNDESTYIVFGLDALEKIVIDNERFSQCKIYVRDIRSVDESLLNNGVVDIALIDAPGLNADSLKTTAVFARQEEIDVVVFVVSAANHFTESAKNFIFSAAREKAYMFMVVNSFDTIRDQERCKQMILKQVASLSPATFKESSELVHFVSSSAIPMIGSGSPGDDDGNDDPSDKGKGKQAEREHDFADLEASLRRFVLEKRAKSKLAPAKTYLLNVLGDVHGLATFNRDVAQSELDRVKKEMDALEPEFEESKKARTDAGETVDRMVEDTTSGVYGHTRDTLNECIAKVGEQDLGIEYPGLFSAYQYAEDIRDSMLHGITESVRLCEEHARTQAVQGFNGIKNLGILHLGNGKQNSNVSRKLRMIC